MRMSALTAAIVFVTACGPAEPPATPAGSVEVNGATYPIVALADGTWRAHVNGASVVCPQPSETACYWAVRHHFQAQELLDDLG